MPTQLAPSPSVPAPDSSGQGPVVLQTNAGRTPSDHWHLVHDRRPGHLPLRAHQAVRKFPSLDRREYFQVSPRAHAWNTPERVHSNEQLGVINLRQSSKKSLIEEQCVIEGGNHIASQPAAILVAVQTACARSRRTDPCWKRPHQC